MLACKGEPADTAVPGEIPATAVVLGPKTCADPSLRQSLGPWEEHEVAADEPTPGAGAVLADFDGDRTLDLFLPDLVSCSLLRGNGDGTFTALPDALPDLGTCSAWGGAAADVDGDGDLDLLVARIGTDSLLLENSGGTFSDTGALSGVVHAAMGGTWGDMDGDGDLDLFIASHSPNPVDLDAPHNPGVDVPEEWGSANALLENDGGVLVDVSDRLADDDRYGFTFGAAFVDLSGDQLPDLYILNDFGDRVFTNRYLQTTCSSPGDCTLRDRSAASALDLQIDSMGMGIGDLNGDLLPDLAITDNYRLHLLLSEGETWYDASASMDLWPDAEEQRNAWGGELVDLDSDGDLDFMATYGPTERALLEEKYLGQPDGLWLQQDGQFAQVSVGWGFAHTDIGRGFVVADLNHDGYPDVVKRRYKGGPTLVLASRCGAASWLKVRLSQEMANTAAVGAAVVVTASGQEHIRWIGAGSTSLASGGPPEALFGLGEATAIERLEVRWPGGGVSVLEDLDVNTVVQISRLR